MASPVCKRRVGPRRWPDEVRVWGKKVTACRRQSPAAEPARAGVRGVCVSVYGGETELEVR